VFTNEYGLVNIRKELVETFYSLPTFRCIQPRDVELLLQPRTAGYDVDPRLFVGKVQVYHYVSRKSQSETSLPSFRDSLTHLKGLKQGSKILLQVQFEDGLLSSQVADKSAAVPMVSISIIFPELRDFIKAGYEVTMKTGYMLKFRVNVEGLTEDHWAQKIEDHQKVSRLVL
jgi:hypothetical protein